MGTYQARALIERILAMPTLETAAAVVLEHVYLLDDDFFVTLDEMMAAESSRESSYHQFLSARFSGGTSDHALDKINAARQRLQALGMLRDYANQVRQASGWQAAGSRSDYQPDAADEAPDFTFVCGGCFETKAVTCPECASNRPTGGVVSGDSGPRCSVCGTVFSEATCQCGTTTYFDGRSADVSLTDEEFLVERDEIVQRLWAAQDRAAPGFDSPELRRAGRSAAEALDELLQRGADLETSLEVGKTWRFLGDAHFCASGKLDQDALAAARVAYTTAEEILQEHGDDTQMAKLNFNFANALRVLDGGQQRANIEEALGRYRRALELFRAIDPRAAAATQDSMRDLYVSLEMLSVKEAGERDRQRIRTLKTRLEEASPDDMAIRSQVQREVERLRDDEITDDFRTGVGKLRSYGAEQDSTWIDEKLRAFDALTHEIRPESSDRANEMMASIRDVLQAVAQQGGLAAERRDGIQRFSSELDALARLRPQTATAKAVRENQLRELMQRLKAAYVSSSRFASN